nr:F-box associated domain, type 1 [Tanacetum cinerariifolium]
MYRRLAENVMADIISRLPVTKIIHSKSVCKNWREIVSDSYLIDHHLSRSPRCVMIHRKIQPELVSEDEDETGNFERPCVLKCLEIEGVLDTSHLHHAIVTSLDLNDIPIFKNTKIIQVGSVNGLVRLWQYHGQVEDDDFRYQNLGILNGCLSLCDSFSTPKLELTVRVMKEYGFKKCWCKELVIKQGIILDVCSLLHASVYLTERSDDGTILMLVNERTLLIYCQKKTIEKEKCLKYCLPELLIVLAFSNSKHSNQKEYMSYKDQ